MLNMKTVLQSIENHVVSLSLAIRSHRHGEGDMEMVNVHYLVCFNITGFRTVAAKETSDSKRGFLPNSIFPSTELPGGEGIGSSRSSCAASVLETSDAPENRELFGTLGGQGGTQLLRGVAI